MDKSPPKPVLVCDLSLLARPRLAWRACRGVLIGTLRESTSDRVSLAAAGCAFFATLALFPAISMLISIYGLVFNVQAVEEQLQLLSEFIPAPAFALIDDRVRHLVGQPSGALSASLVVSFLLTFWSASAGTKSTLSALNVAYDVAEQRSIIRFQLIALLMTLCAVLAAVFAIAFLVFLPAVFAFVGVPERAMKLINWLGMALLIALVLTTIVLLYRFGPSRPKPSNQRLWPGALLATALWMIASELLSQYIASISSFGATYGSLGAVVGVMLWFYVSAYAVLLGAELNAQLEQAAQRARDIGAQRDCG